MLRSRQKQQAVQIALEVGRREPGFANDRLCRASFCLSVGLDTSVSKSVRRL